MLLYLRIKNTNHICCGRSEKGNIAVHEGLADSKPWMGAGNAGTCSFTATEAP